MLYINFSFPILFLIFILTFKKQIKNFISNLIESEFKFGDNSINLKRRIEESKKEIASEYGEELAVAKENIRE